MDTDAKLRDTLLQESYDIKGDANLSNLFLSKYTKQWKELLLFLLKPIYVLKSFLENFRQ